MKYDTDKPLECIMRQSRCYQRTTTFNIKGILWHSTGANNPQIKRYVQPDDNDPNRAFLLSIIGKNQYGNDWNHTDVKKGVNAFVGKDAKGNIISVQCLPWNYRAWGVGDGSKGSANDCYIQFEICEDSLTDPNYFSLVYNEACELTAYLCRLYNIDPFGSFIYKGITLPTIICHWDSYQYGIGSEHSDVYHWFKKYNKDMATVRNDVKKILQEADEMTVEEVKKIVKEEMKREQDALKDNDCGNWSKEAREWAIKNGIISGIGNGADGKPNYAWEMPITREQVVALLYRLNK